MVQCPITNDQWHAIRHLVERKRVGRGGRPSCDPRIVFNAIIWAIANDEKWRRLPAEFGPSQTAYRRWVQLKRSGRMDKIFEILAASNTPAGGDAV
ncbi:transposase [Paraburkholderia sp. HP33-1]|uniref:transposase n=1 Tax=Paraburkholderia sp. HP33-1 TaxID=2883243 RepID=UPI003FA358FA